MKTQHKNIFKAGLQLVAALLATVFSSILALLQYFFSSDKNSEESDSPEFFAEDSDGNLVSYKDGNYRIIGK